jgi:hypothetical protein
MDSISACSKLPHSYWPSQSKDFKDAKDIKDKKDGIEGRGACRACVEESELTAAS